ncbi:pyridoxal kinase isoform X4 [Cryptomeria japonica]|uniref:pyridoxal kinase isoform X4 n=1 Tax=Cryptomeria japonica TaxID=3369 RepID=UPI0027DA1A23|nr:pyridoxal kinase isoform X4 [Cryptomeria japonica]
MLEIKLLYFLCNFLVLMWTLSIQSSYPITQGAGYPTVRGQVLNGEQLWTLIEGLEANDLLCYTHLLTGYIGSVSFLDTILQVVQKLRSVNPDLIYVCDPVMGDEGKLYIPPELVSVYREKVVPVASMITPNHFEAEHLTGLRISCEADGLRACNALHAAGPSKVVITSLEMDGMLLLIGSHQKTEGHPTEQFKIVMPKIPAYFTGFLSGILMQEHLGGQAIDITQKHFQGTGDLMTALLLGWSNKYPQELWKAAELAVATVQAILHRTISDYNAAAIETPKQLEIQLIQSHDDIKSPQVTYFAEKY